MYGIEGCLTRDGMDWSEPAKWRRAGAVGLVLFLLALGGLAKAGGGTVQWPASESSSEPERTSQRVLTRFDEPGAREEMATRMAEERRQAKEVAWEIAVRDGRQPWGQSGHVHYELMAVRKGLVYVMKTLNLTAAVSTTVDLIRDVAPYELSGAGQMVGVWDGGSARASHQELSGRVTIGDGSRAVDHSTHVTGTIAAAGTKARALGLAPDAEIASYDYDEDVAEVALLAKSTATEADKIQISNHSYGWVCGWDYSGYLPAWYGTWGERESDLFGIYDETARDWDVVCYAAPYYLPFKAAGNDRLDSVPSPGEQFEYYTERGGWQFKQYSLNSDPYPDAWDQGGYDTLPSDSTAKNTVTVGAVDISEASDRDLDEVTMTSFSSWGPTDDGRVKPDLVTHGVDIYSCTAGSDRSYDTYSGTSMATAVASGAAALLPEFYARFSPDRAMRAATIKALLIHTADDLGNPGPDYSYGWGLINAKAAVDHIQTHFDYPDISAMVEDAVDLTTTTQSYVFLWDGVSPIRATLVWTDPPGSEIEGLDNPEPCLVNDLDLRIVDPEGTIHLPFVLDPSEPGEPATMGDNTLDNVEQVWIETPLVAGRYCVQVTYKGTLVDDEQAYSLLLSGQHSDTASTDLNADGVVDLLDVSQLSGMWMSEQPGADVAPTGGDGVINMLDFGRLTGTLSHDS